MAELLSGTILVRAGKQASIKDKLASNGRPLSAVFDGDKGTKYCLLGGLRFETHDTVSTFKVHTPVV